MVVQDKAKACAELVAAQRNLASEAPGVSQTEKALGEIKDHQKKDCDVIPEDPLKPIAKNVENVLEASMEAQYLNEKPTAERGEKIVNSVCISCHGTAGNMYGFFSDPQAMKKHLTEHPEFVKTVEERMNNKENLMPEFGLMKPLSRRDVSEYLKQFSAK